MTRSEVIQLLGLPEAVNGRYSRDNQVSESIAATGREFEYVLGVYSGFRMDYDVLVFYFDEDGIVHRWDIYQT